MMFDNCESRLKEFVDHLRDNQKLSQNAKS